MPEWGSQDQEEGRPPVVAGTPVEGNRAGQGRAVQGSQTGQGRQLQYCKVEDSQSSLDQ
jgi:hypothetical protein